MTAPSFVEDIASGPVRHFPRSICSAIVPRELHMVLSALRLDLVVNQFAHTLIWWWWRRWRGGFIIIGDGAGFAFSRRDCDVAICVAITAEGCRISGLIGFADHVAVGFHLVGHAAGDVGVIDEQGEVRDFERPTVIVDDHFHYGDEGRSRWRGRRTFSYG